jgi:hypothetical protein
VDFDREKDMMAASHPQPEYRVTLTLAVVDPYALWTMAAARLIGSSSMTVQDVIDVIGPRDDPSVADCIAAMARPAPIAGCTFDDFWVDGLRERGPGSDVDAVTRPRLVATATPPARRAAKRRHIVRAVRKGPPPAETLNPG